MTKGITLGFNDQGLPIELDLSRTGPSRSMLLAGTSGSGKSVLIRALIQRAVAKGFRFIILETKTGDPPDFLPWYPEIPPYIAQSSDADTIAMLLHGDRNDLSILIDVCREGDTWDQIYAKLQVEMENTKRHPLERKDAKMVAHFLGNLIREMKTIKDISTNLYDLPLVSVMDLRPLSENMQKLIAASTATWLLHYAEDTIFIIDEYHKQGRNRQVEGYASEGRSKGDFLIAADQNITKLHSDLRQNFQTWTIFRQNDLVKSERAAKQSPGTDLKPKDAMRLKTGECYVFDYNESTTDKIFVWGDWYDEQKAKDVATGKLSVKDLPKSPAPPAKLVSPFGVLKRDYPITEEEDYTDLYERVERLLA